MANKRNRRESKKKAMGSCDGEFHKKGRFGKAKFKVQEASKIYGTGSIAVVDEKDSTYHKIGRIAELNCLKRRRNRADELHRLLCKDSLYRQKKPKAINKPRLSKNMELSKKAIVYDRLQASKLRKNTRSKQIAFHQQIFRPKSDSKFKLMMWKYFTARKFAWNLKKLKNFKSRNFNYLVKMITCKLEKYLNLNRSISADLYKKFFALKDIFLRANNLRQKLKANSQSRGFFVEEFIDNQLVHWLKLDEVSNIDCIDEANVDIIDTSYCDQICKNCKSFIDGMKIHQCCEAVSVVDNMKRCQHFIHRLNHYFIHDQICKDCESFIGGMKLRQCCYKVISVDNMKRCQHFIYRLNHYFIYDQICKDCESFIGGMKLRQCCYKAISVDNMNDGLNDTDMNCQNFKGINDSENDAISADSIQKCQHSVNRLKIAADDSFEVDVLPDLEKSITDLKIEKNMLEEPTILSNIGMDSEFFHQNLNSTNFDPKSEYNEQETFNEMKIILEVNLEDNLILQDFYGKKRVHAAYQEEYGDDLLNKAYYKRNLTHPATSDSDLLDIVDTMNDIIDSVDKNLGGKQWRNNKERNCDIDCKFFEYWPLVLHHSFEKMFDSVSTENKMHDIVRAVVMFEACPGCENQSENCKLNEKCQDRIRMLRKIMPHFQGLRTLTRSIYSLRGSANWIARAQSYIANNDFIKFKEFIDDEKNLHGKIHADVNSQQSHDDKCEETIFENSKEVLEQFIKGCYDFPKEVCSICNMWTNDVRMVDDLENFPNKDNIVIASFIENLKNRSSILPLKICKNRCFKDIKAGCIPLLSIQNNMAVAEIPREIHCLNIFETFLIKIARTFQTIIKLQPLNSKNKSFHGDRYVDALKGLAVHLRLPLKPTHEYLQQKLPCIDGLNVLVDSYPTKKQIVWRTIVDLDKVYSALRKLKEINPLYEKIDINTDFQLSKVNLPIDNVGDPTLNTSLQQPDFMSMLKKSSDCEPYVNITVENIGGNDIDPNLTDSEIYRFQKVQSDVLKQYDNNIDLDTLCYPELYPNGEFGCKASRPRTVSSSMFIKHKLLNADPRFRLSNQYVFHLLSLYDERAISQSIFAMMKQRKSDKLTVGMLKDKVDLQDKDIEARLNTMASKNRGWTEYWSNQSLCLQAMDEKFGPATFFLTLSAAEYEWEDMLAYLKLMNNLDDTNSVNQSVLCAKDPISVAIHFRRRFSSFLNNFLLSAFCPLGQVEQYYARVEYQARGAPHFHIKLWIKDAPILGVNADDEIIQFINKHIKCNMPGENVNARLANLVQKFQVHKCNSSCLRCSSTSKKTVRCRYGFPRVESQKTTLTSVEASVRSRTSRSKKVLKTYTLIRRLDSVRINDYNPEILLAWEANMDIQYIGENSRVLNRYITKYMTKGEKNSNKDIWEKIDQSKPLMNKLFWLSTMRAKSRQTSAYEAADKLLGHPYFYSSCSVQFVNTYPPEMRSRRLKPYKDIESMDKNSTDVFMNNLVDTYYPNRPNELESKSLYEIATWYEVSKIKPKSKEVHAILDGSLGYLRKRIKPKVISTYYSFAKTEAAAELYFRSLLMLYKPWRNENELLGNSKSYREEFEMCVDQFPDMKNCEEVRRKIKEALEKVDQWRNHESSNKEKFNLSKNKDVQNIDVSTIQQNEFDEIVHVDIMDNDETSNFTCMEIEEPITINDVDELAKKVSQLNYDQKSIFDKIINHVEEQDKVSSFTTPIRLIVSGVAGTGKSFLIEMLSNMIQSKYNSTQCETVAILAPTGISAFNVNGKTIHGFFKLPVQHGCQAIYKPLSLEDKKRFKMLWRDLRLIIVDEMSMISNVTLAMIHCRLRDCLGDNINSYFGNKNIVLFGDLLQLSPVNGQFLFEEISIENCAKYFQGSVGMPHLWSKFTYSELTQNMRQNDDLEYATMLGEIRLGNLTEDHVKKLKSRLIGAPGVPMEIKIAIDYYANNLLCSGNNTICLMSKNSMVDEFNLGMLKLLGIKTEFIYASDKCPSIKLQKNKKSKASDTGGLEDCLNLGIEARVMLRRNISFDKGLVNGTLGTVKQFLKNGTEIVGIMVKFDHLDDCERIDRVTVEYDVSKSIKVSRSQFPLCLAYAITIHKSQGLTLNSALIDIGINCFEDAMAYVALSRVKSLNQVYLISFEPSKIRCRTVAANEYNKLRISVGLSDIKRINEIPIGYRKARISLKRKAMIDLNGDKRDEIQKPCKKIKGSNNFGIFPLKNSGVSCYSNVVLQSLFRMKEVLLKASELNDPISQELKAFLDITSISQPTSGDVFRTLIGGDFATQRQQDPHEFLCSFIKVLNCETISQMFQFVLRKTATCFACKSVQNIDCQMDSIFCEINNSNCTSILAKSMVYPTAKEDKFLCFKCDRSSIHHVNYQYLFPEECKYLIVYLPLYDDKMKRFSNRCIKQFNSNNFGVDQKSFSTISAICHTGRNDSMTSGHYTVWLKVEDGWVNANDSIISGKRLRFIKNLENVLLLIMEKQ